MNRKSIIFLLMLLFVSTLTSEGIASEKPEVTNTLTMDSETYADTANMGQIKDTAFLISQNSKKAPVHASDKEQELDISGSPSKGPVDAPVLIVVFSDFQ